jgi:hypothetical protein
MVAVRNGAKSGIDVFDELGKVQRELPVRLDGADVVRPGIILLRLSRVVSVPFHNYDVVCVCETRDIVSAVILTGIIAGPGGSGRLVVALAMPVKEVDDRISAVTAIEVRGREEHAKVPRLAKYLAVVLQILDAAGRLPKRDDHEEYCGTDRLERKTSV